MGCPNDCLHFHGLWRPGLLGPTHKNIVTWWQGSSPNLSCYILGSNKALLFLNARFTISYDLREFHPSERNKLPSVHCAQGHSHLSMFRKDWQQPDLHKPGDRVAFPVCLSLCVCVCTFLVVTTTRGLGDHFSLRSIIVLLVAVYIVVSASEGAVHMVAGVLWRFDIELPPKKTG